TPDPAILMLIGQTVSIIPLVVLLYCRSQRLLPIGGGASLSKAAIVGGLEALAMVSYLYATREAAPAPVMEAIALYPALPVVLAVIVLKERSSRQQMGGLGIAAIVLPFINLAG